MKIQTRSRQRRGVACGDGRLSTHMAAYLYKQEFRMAGGLPRELGLLDMPRYVMDFLLIDI
jgi:hypothetical protein